MNVLKKSCHEDVWEVEVVLHSFVTPALHAGETKASVPRRKPPPQYLLDRKLGVPQMQSGYNGSKRNHFPCWKSNPDHNPQISLPNDWTIQASQLYICI